MPYLRKIQRYLSMKVGVYLGKISTEAGGGYIFQSEVLSALTELAETSRHMFYLLTYRSDGLEPYLRSGHVKLEILTAADRDDYGSLWKTKASKLKTRLQRTFLSPKEEIKKRNELPDHTDLIQKAVRSLEIDVIWFAGPTFEVVPDVPYLATVWDLQHRLQPFFPEVSSDGWWEFREAFFGKYLCRAALVITGSQVGQAEIERFYQVPSERIRVLPHPTPQFALDHFSVDQKETLEKYGINPGYLLYPAQFWPHKNHVNLLLALQLLRERYQLNIPLVLVGSDQGNMGYVRDTIAKLSLSSLVHILGFVPQKDLAVLYQNAFALTYMTFFGPDNLPPLEAFALGCPVISSDVSGAREQFGDAALFVDPAEPGEIARAVMLLEQDDDLRSTLVSRGRKRAEHWTRKDFVRRLFDILDDFERVRRNWK